MYNVLITDDESDARLFIENIIRQLLPDINIYHAEYPSEALKLAKIIKFDLIFIDIVMPEMNGLEVIEKITKANYNPFIVIVSAHKNFEFAQQGIYLGVSGYISKPIYKKQFIPIIDKFISKQKLAEATPAEKTISLSTYIGYCMVKTDDIVVIEKTGRNLIDIYTIETVINRVRGTLAELLTSLPSDFIYINRQCAVKKEMIKLFNPKTKQITVKIGETDKEFTCSKTIALAIAKLYK